MHRAGAIGSHPINGGLKALPKAGVGEQGPGRWTASGSDGRGSFSWQVQRQTTATAAITSIGWQSSGSLPLFEQPRQDATRAPEVGYGIERILAHRGDKCLPLRGVVEAADLFRRAGPDEGLRLIEHLQPSCFHCLKVHGFNQAQTGKIFRAVLAPPARKLSKSRFAARSPASRS